MVIFFWHAERTLFDFCRWGIFALLHYQAAGLAVYEDTAEIP
jgi:hypothetical protein